MHSLQTSQVIKKNLLTGWREEYPFRVYCLGFIFIVFFSIKAIHDWPDFWTRFSISLACLAPALLVFCKIYKEGLRLKNLPKEIIVIAMLVFLGALNVFFSEEVWVSLKGVVLFVLSGLMVFFAVFYLFRLKRNQIVFYYLCSICLVIFCCYRIYIVASPDSGDLYRLFSYNLIPAGSLINLLLIGPLMLLAEEGRWGKRIVLILLIFLAVATDFLLFKRGPILAIVVMAIVYGIIASKTLRVLSLVLLTSVAVGYQFGGNRILKDKFESIEREGEKVGIWVESFSKWRTILIRMEYYPLAFAMLKEKPVLGIGYNTSIIKNFPVDYHNVFFDKRYFGNHVKQANTFDNIVLSIFVETGLIFSITYFGSVGIVVLRLVNLLKINSEYRVQSMILLMVLFGFFAHSMTFDSLKYPPLSWVFHSVLAIAANLKVGSLDDSPLQNSLEAPEKLPEKITNANW